MRRIFLNALSILTVLFDALGNPIAFFLTGGEAHDLVGADHLCPRWKRTR
jgi:hypothetical protein